MRLVANDLTVIIPVAPKETQWSGLLADLKKENPKLKIICVGPECPRGLEKIWLQAPLGRAIQMNLAAMQASTKYLWFLHADTRLSKGSLDKLLKSLNADRGALHYFGLAFLPDGPKLMFLNSLGAYVRSRFGGMPYGDQGFCLSREKFLQVGGFPKTNFGEDHLLVWQWRQCGFRLKPVEGVIFTSARKYKNRGWLRTTAKHLWLGSKQALAELDVLQRRSKKGAVAIFVKTPKYSPVKTRMAKDSSRDFAIKFHELAAECTAAEVKTFNAEGFWAVAEKEGLREWRGLKTIYQGKGGLGERLHKIYNDLIAEHSWVILLGADCPELQNKHLENAKALLETNDFVIGPASDGGFYLFGGRKRVPKSVWTSINYSVESTGEELAAALERENLKRIAYLEELVDVDTVADARALFQRLKKIKAKTEKIKLLEEHVSQCLL